MRVLVVLALLVVVVAVAIAWWSRPVPAGGPVATSGQTTGLALGRSAKGGGTPSGTAAPAGATPLVIQVVGKVHRPGVVRLPAGSRVGDAIEAVGGALPGTDLGYLNLARKLTDGEQIAVGITPPPAAAGAPATAGAPGQLVNLNTASATDLDKLPGVGPALAQRIIDYRTEHGGFRTVDELRQVSGIGDAKYQDLKDLVTV